MGTFLGGIEIGEQIDRWLGIQLPGAGQALNTTGTDFSRECSGSNICHWQPIAAGQQLGGGNPDAPSDGYMLVTSLGGASAFEGCDNTLGTTAPAASVEVPVVGTCYDGTAPFVLFLPRSSAQTTPLQTFTGGSAQPVTGEIAAPAAPPSQSQAEAAAAEQLQGNAGTYQDLEEWLAQARCAPDPLSNTIPVPTVLPAESTSDYQQCLAQLGLKVKSTTPLLASQADFGAPASDLVNTVPAPGNAVASGSAIKLIRNPNTMPVATQRQSKLASLLNTSANPGITSANAFDVARQSLSLEDAATGNTDKSGDAGDASYSNCSTMPIFVTGHDAQSAGDHDMIALGVAGTTTDPSLTFSQAYGATNPGWVRLTRDIGSSKDDGWKASYQPCNQPRPNVTAQCDEFPFLASQQGGGAVTPVPNLQYISGPQNGLLGTRLSQFYSSSTSGPTSLGFNGCDMSVGNPFLAVPVPDFANVNTTWACNGKN